MGAGEPSGATTGALKLVPDGLLDLILENATEAYVTVDEEGAITWGSPSVRALLGHEPTDWLGHHVLDFVHPDDLDTALPSLLRVTSGETIGEPVIVRARHADGQWLWVEALTRSIEPTPGTRGAMFSLRDITARVEVEDALRTSEQRLTAYLENSRDLMARVEGDGTITWVSGNVVGMLGYEPQEILGTNAFELVDPADLDEVLERFAGVVARQGRPSPLVLDVRRKDGTSLTVEGLGSALPDDGSGNPGVVVNVRDATARIEAERALRESEARFRTVMQQSYDVVAVIDAAAAIKWVTPNSERLLGWTPEEVVGRNGLELVHPDDVELMLDELAAFSDHRGVPNPTVIKMLHKDGSWHHVELVGTDLLDNPDIEGIALNLRGADERMAVEADLHRRTDIFELTSDLVGIVTEEGTVVYLNAAAKAFFGIEDIDHSSKDALGETFTEASRGRLALEVGPALAEGATWSGELELRRADGVVVPMLTQMLAHRDGEGTIRYISGVYRDISERKAFESRLEHEATHDPLTGLPNRSLLLDRLEQALARGRRRRHSVGVLFCDLDHFKLVNDSLGHSVGDRLLVEIARRLESQLRPGDTVARFGGDEFIILCEDLDAPADAAVIAERVDDAVRTSFSIGTDEVHVGISIGIAVATAGIGEAEELIRDADAAMYGAKARGRGRHQLFEAGMWEQAVDRFDLVNALRGAVERGEFELHYQPIVDLRDDRIGGVEALLRWHHPQRGLLRPDDFIAVAEETGAIIPIGAWVVGEACRRLEILNRDRDGIPLTMSVNLSARQLGQPDLADRLADAITTCALDPALLDLEITESVLMDDVEHSRLTLERLRALGVRISVDDFGTGYSSLSYLRRFPVNQLKVDRAFVDGLAVEPENRAIVAAIVNLAHTLGMVATAEGVETAEQRAILEELGCDRAQGFLLAEPCAADELTRLLATPV